MQCNENQLANSKQLLMAVSVSLLFIGLRVWYTLVALVTMRPKLNPVTGSLAVRVCLSLIPELVTAFVFVGTGIWTRHIRHEQKLPNNAEMTDLNI